MKPWLLLLIVLATSATGCGDGNPAPGSIPASSQASQSADYIPPAGSTDLPAEAYSESEVIVVFRHGITTDELAAAGVPSDGPVTTRRNPSLRQDGPCERLAAHIAAELGIMLDNEVYRGRTRMAEYRLPAGVDMFATITRINDRYGDFVLDAAPSQLAIPAFTPDDPDFLNSGNLGGPQWYLHAMDFERAWDITTGDPGVLVAVLDSGCNLQHEELAGQVIDPELQWPGSEADIANGNSSMEDSYGHGTAVCGLLAAATDNSRTLAGAAPACGVVPIKVTNDWIDFTIGNYIEGGYLADEFGADILVQSFTIWEANPAVHDMLQDLADSGMLLFGAAGNDGTETDNWPAAWPEVISVASVDPGGSRSSFSNLAGSVELAAPGSGIRICGHQFNSGALAYLTEEGTSLSTPLAAAAAALLWSSDPGLATDRVRELLAITGDPATGFESALPVVNAGNLLKPEAFLKLPQLPGMVLSGETQIDAEVVQEPQLAVLSLDGMAVDTLGLGPWQFSLPTQSVLFGPAQLQLDSTLGILASTDAALVLVDNTSGSYPLRDGAEATDGLFAAFDAAYAQQQARLAMENLFLPDWTEESLRQFGKGRWQRITSDSAEGSSSWYCGIAGEMDYDRHEFDCLISARIDLGSANQPVLRFSQRYNIQYGDFGYDRASVLFSTDNGASWQTQSGEGHPGWFSGYQADWDLIEIPLNTFIGEQLYICFSLQSDGLLEGEQPGEDRGWWLDAIYVGEEDGSNSADFRLAAPMAGEVFGTVPSRNTVELRFTDIANFSRLDYSLDCRPFGRNDGEDLSGSTTSQAGVNLSLGGLARPNQFAWLSLVAYNQDETAGRSMLVPVAIFNLAGDVDADGDVDASDLQVLRDSIGLQAGDSGWTPFLDSDQDGIATERDLAALGYNWTGSD